MTAAVFQMHAGDNCWHGNGLHYLRRPAKYIVASREERFLTAALLQRQHAS